MADDNADPRLAQVIRFHNGSAVMLPGSHATPEGQRVHKIAQALADYGRRGTDLRASASHMLTSELEERRRGSSAVLAQEVETAAKTLADARWNHRLAMSSASAVKPGKDVGYYDAMIDVELRRDFKALDPSKQAQAVARMLGDPLPQLRLIEALVRAPDEVSGLPPGVAQALQANLFARLRPGDFAALDTKAAQINAVHRAVAIGVEVLAQSGVNVVRDTPTAHGLVSDTEQSTPLRWLSPEVDPRYAPEESLLAA